MSLQDDYYDLRDGLQHESHQEKLDRIWFAFCDLETKEMVSKGECTEQDYKAWRVKQLEKLKKSKLR